MHRAIVAALCSAMASAVGRAQSQLSTEAARIVRFRGRTIDLQPFYQGFPYLGFRVDTRAGKLLFFHDTPEGRRLLQLPIDRSGAAIDLTAGERLGDIDWNRRGLRDLRYLPSRGEYVVLADDANEERFNLFAMASDTGAIRRLTDHDYVYGVGTNQERTRIAYVPRHGTRAPYRSCLRIIDVATLEDREVVCDTPELTFTWCTPSLSPDGRWVVINANRANDRKHQNLVLIDLESASPALRVLTDIERRRRNVAVLEEWLDDDSFVYTSDEDGFTNVYRMDLAPHSGAPSTASAVERPRSIVLQPTSVQLTRFREDVDSIARFETAPDVRTPLTVAGRTSDSPSSPARPELRLGVVVKRPYESELFVIDPLATTMSDADASGAVAPILDRRVFDATLVLLDYDENTAYFSAQSRRTSFQLQQVSYGRATRDAEPHEGIVARTRASVPESVARAVDTCEVERVSIPTFDEDPRTGRARTLHAYLHRPRNPWPLRSQQLAVIQSFYGGENRWDHQAQVLCAAGITVLSPSVRGSAGFGAEFAALNDHDLGGNEMFDLVWVGRWLAHNEGLRERQIGVYGASHGGYAAMRALTMPDEVNGRRDRFDWGFGLSWFGFSNIVSFYERCNIPDWVLLEAGDPRTERDKLLDRSPITHVDRIRAPLLLLHGENDNRVPVSESRQMAEALRRARKRFVYEEFAGQGHGLKGIENQHRVWTTVFRFLEQQVDRRPLQRTSSDLRRRARRAWPTALVLSTLVATLALAARIERSERST